MPLRSWPFLFIPLLVACGAQGDPLGTAAQPVTTCAQGSTLDGIDVSHYNGDIDWARVRASGKTFAFVKATEGLTYVDPQFSLNWAAMSDNGIVRSAYHFFHPGDDPIVQVDHFLETMGPLEPGDLPPTLDLEVTDGVDGATITQNANQWLARVADATGMKPILYASPSFVTDTLGSPPELGDSALLWVAHWGAVCPSVPAPFSSWAFWQDSDMAMVPGVDSGAVDLNVFNGTTDDLGALTARATPPDASSGASGGAASANAGFAAGDAAGAGGATSGTFGSGGDGAAFLGASGGGAGAAAEEPHSTPAPDLRGGCALAPGRADLRPIACFLALLLGHRRLRPRRRLAARARSSRTLDGYDA